MASEPKTKPTDLDVKDFLAAVPDEQRRQDCRTLVKLMQAATGQQGRMWGSGIVGFGTYRQAYASGKTGDWPLIAFAPRKNDLTLYITPGFERFDELLARLGKHKTGKACLYVKRLADLDAVVLGRIITESVAAMASKRISC